MLLNVLKFSVVTVLICMAGYVTAYALIVLNSVFALELWGLL